jgi:NADPH2:quinone reductase
MRHLVCHSFGTSDGLAIRSAPDPQPGPGDVLVRINASNIAFVDRLLVRGSYQFRPPVPFTPGVVGAGVIVSTGADIKHLQPGNRVAVLKADFGVWSTNVVIPAEGVVQMPSGVSDIAAASSIEAYGTASYALEDRGRIHAGEVVLVLGASGAVGHAAVEVALHLGARVVAVSSNPDLWAESKIKPHVILDRRTTHLREAMRELFPDGVDIVVDPVGGPMAEAALRSLNFGGRYLIVGFASGAIQKLPANYVLLRNRSAVGVEWASWIRANPRHVARSLEIVLTRLARGVLSSPSAATVTLDQLPDVLLADVPPSGLVRTVVLPHEPILAPVQGAHP